MCYITYLNISSKCISIFSIGSFCMNILEVKNIVKRFGNYAANNNISFNVKYGSIFGLLGPNGAGKTTLIRMICDIFSPDEGSISLFDQTVGNVTQNRIGYLPEERGLYKKIKVIDQIIYFARLRGMSHKEAKLAGEKWLDKMGASHWGNKKIEELSKGMQQKIQFITTVVHSPDFIILDEPFSGFDPINTELLKNIILEMRSLGKTFILSTHIMSQVEELCDAVCMINKGEVVLSGNITDIKKSYSKNTIILEYSSSATTNNNSIISSSINNLFGGVQLLSNVNNRAVLKITDENFDKKQFLNTVSELLDITKFAIETPSMHEIFISSCSK